MNVRALALVLPSLLACGKSGDGKSPAAAPPPSNPGAATAPKPPPPPASRPSQQGLTKMPERKAAPTDPTARLEIALGHKLFLDPRLSVDGSRSCYSCHDNDQGTGGKDPIAIGAGDKPLKRHSPQLWNVAAFQGAFYWDGRSASLEDQAKAAWGGGNMGVGTEPGKLDAKASEIGKLADYAAVFAKVYPGQAVTPDLVVRAIAAYERTLVCDDTAYDRFAAGDKTALTEAQQRGYDVFAGKGGCMTCHAPPYFSTAAGVAGGAYFNVGIGTDKPEADVDPGRKAVTQAAEDWAAFKPPSLRNVAKTAPYFHNGSVASLTDAVKLMASGGIANPHRSPLLTDRKLSEAEVADVVAFLDGLSCGGAIDEQPPAFGTKPGQLSLETGTPNP